MAHEHHNDPNDTGFVENGNKNEVNEDDENYHKDDNHTEDVSTKSLMSYKIPGDDIHLTGVLPETSETI